MKKGCNVCNAGVHLSNLEEKYKNYKENRSENTNPLLRRLYTNIEQARLYNTRYLLHNKHLDVSGIVGRFAVFLLLTIPQVHARSKCLIFKWLLEAGCDFKEADEQGMTLLLWLLNKGEVVLSKMLIKDRILEIDFSHKDVEDNTCLMHAVRTKDVDIVTSLADIHVRFGIQMDVRNNQGLTPYSEAVRLQLSDIAKVLKKTGLVNISTAMQPFKNLRMEPYMKTMLTAKNHQKTEKSTKGEDNSESNQMSTMISKSVEGKKKSDRFCEVVGLKMLHESAKGRRTMDDGTMNVKSRKVVAINRLISTPPKKWDATKTKMKKNVSKKKSVSFSDEELMEPKDVKKSLLCRPQVGLYKPSASLITYKDVREMFPRETNSGSSSMRDIEWIRNLQGEQISDSYRKGIADKGPQPATDVPKRKKWSIVRKSIMINRLLTKHDNCEYQ